MDETTRTEKHEQPAYKTSKQVQAWFLGRSRDRWKQKCAELRVESKRLRQQVADVRRSRADWRGKAEDALREAKELRAQLAELRGQLDVSGEASQKNA